MPASLGRLACRYRLKTTIVISPDAGILGHTDAYIITTPEILRQRFLLRFSGITVKCTKLFPQLVPELRGGNGDERFGALPDVFASEKRYTILSHYV